MRAIIVRIVTDVSSLSDESAGIAMCFHRKLTRKIIYILTI